MVPSIAILPPLLVGKASGEDTPMVFLEALTFGVVPATTAIASVPEVVKDGKRGILGPSAIRSEHQSDHIAQQRPSEADAERLSLLRSGEF
jgi:hypothetical protein